MMMKKGMSQVIAYTLLISLAVAIGVFVTVWAKSSAEQQVKTVLTPAATGAECAGVNLNVNFSLTPNAGDPEVGCELRIYNAGNLKWQRIEFNTVPNWGDRPYAIDVEVMPREWYDFDLTGYSGPLDVEIFPVIEVNGQLAKCQKNRVYSAPGAGFQC